MNMKIVSPEFFEKSTLETARRLLGKYIAAGDFLGKIAETEAYLKDDSASHSFRGKTPRNSAMFGPPGRAYVYFTYGMHHCFNIVTNKEETGEAVLIRAVEPIKGIEMMKRNRKMKDAKDLCNGPAKFTQAFGISKKDNGLNLLDKKSGIKLMEGDESEKFDIVEAKRIGIKNNQELNYRFYIKNNEFVSRG